MNQLNACKICLELWTFIIYMTCIGGNFSALCIKSAKAGQTIYTHAWLRIPYLWQLEVWLYVWSQVVAVQTECFWALFILFSFNFAALVANKVIIIKRTIEVIQRYLFLKYAMYGSQMLGDQYIAGPGLSKFGGPVPPVSIIVVAPMLLMPTMA